MKAYSQTKSAIRFRKMREKKRFLGICHECPEKAMFNRVRCEKHNKLNNIRTRVDQKKRPSRGLCERCGKPLGSEDSGFKSHNRNACKLSRRGLRQ